MYPVRKPALSSIRIRASNSAPPTRHFGAWNDYERHLSQFKKEKTKNFALSGSMEKYCLPVVLVRPCCCRFDLLYAIVLLRSHLVGVVMHHRSLYAFPPESSSNCPNQPAIAWVEFHMPERKDKHFGLLILIILTINIQRRMRKGWECAEKANKPELYGMQRRMLLRWFHHNTKHRGWLAIRLWISVLSCGSIFPFLRVHSSCQCMCALRFHQERPHHQITAIDRLWVMTQLQLDCSQCK